VARQIVGCRVGHTLSPLRDRPCVRESVLHNYGSPGTLNVQWMLGPTGTRTGQASTLRVSAAPPYDPYAPAVPRTAVTPR